MKNKLIFTSVFIALFIFLIMPEVYGMDVFVKTSKKTTKLQMESTNTVLDLKTAYKTKTGVNEDEQILIFSDNYLEDEKTLSDYNIVKNSIIYISVLEYELNNITPEKVSGNTTSFSVKLNPNDGYYLSDYLNVFIDGSEAEKKAFTYDNKTGIFAIPIANLKDTLKLQTDAYKKYKVTLEANGGKFSDGATQKVLDYWDQSVYSKLEKPTKENAEFKGYYTEKSGGTTLEAYVNESGIDSEKTFYAIWEDDTVYKAVSGDNGIWDKEESYPIVTSSTESTVKKVAYRVKGKSTFTTLTKDNDYTIESPTMIVLTEKFFKKLDSKEYEVYIYYANGYTPITIKVNKSTNNENKTTENAQQENKTSNNKTVTNTSNTTNTTNTTNTATAVKNPQTGDNIKFVFIVLLISLTLLFVTRKFEKNL